MRGWGGGKEKEGREELKKTKKKAQYMILGVESGGKGGEKLYFMANGVGVSALLVQEKGEKQIRQRKRGAQK